MSPSFNENNLLRAFLLYCLIIKHSKLQSKNPKAIHWLFVINIGDAIHTVRRSSAQENATGRPPARISADKTTSNPRRNSTSSTDSSAAEPHAPVPLATQQSHFFNLSLVSIDQPFVLRMCLPTLTMSLLQLSRDSGKCPPSLLSEERVIQGDSFDEDAMNVLDTSGTFVKTDSGCFFRVFLTDLLFCRLFIPQVCSLLPLNKSQMLLRLFCR